MEVYCIVLDFHDLLDRIHRVCCTLIPVLWEVLHCTRIQILQLPHILLLDLIGFTVVEVYCIVLDFHDLIGFTEFAVLLYL